MINVIYHLHCLSNKYKIVGKNFWKLAVELGWLFGVYFDQGGKKFLVA
jgi:hypothetical protein